MIEVEVEVEDEAWREVAEVEAAVERAAKATLALSPVLQERSGTATLLLTDDETVRELNARFRGRDEATNVLSFPAPDTAAPHLGDIALAHGICAREAAAQGKTLTDHLAHLVVHGVLHLFGYDHDADEEAEVMEGLERVVLAELGVADPYRLDEIHAGS